MNFLRVDASEAVVYSNVNADGSVSVVATNSPVLIATVLAVAIPAGHFGDIHLSFDAVYDNGVPVVLHDQLLTSYQGGATSGGSPPQVVIYPFGALSLSETVSWTPDVNVGGNPPNYDAIGPYRASDAYITALVALNGLDVDVSLVVSSGAPADVTFKNVRVRVEIVGGA